MKYTVIAEIAGGHMGKLSRCIQLIEAAGDAKADSIKFQFYNADELCTRNHEDYNLFKELEFSYSEWIEIFAKARRYKMLIYADIFGNESFSQAHQLGIDGFKLHSADLDNSYLLQAVSNTEKTIFLGVGGHKRVEIYQSIKKIKAWSPNSQIILMPGHQLFPTPVSEHSLNEIKWFSKAYKDLGIKVGCADHIDGDHPFAIGFPLAAIGAGAIVVEKHLTVHRKDKWEDYESALDAKQFKYFVSMVHNLNETGTFPVWTAGRQHYREKAIKNYIPTNSISQQEMIGLHNVQFVRTKKYQNPIPSENLLDRPAVETLTKNQIICGSNIDQKIGILLNCRTASTRLPQKALKKICGKETIALLIERMKFCKEPTNIVLCTTENPEDDILIDIAKREGIESFRGPEINVALRLLMASKKYQIDHIVRVTGDDLLRDISLIDKAIISHRQNNADYTYMKGVVYSCDTEIISHRALETIVERASCPDNTEYLTWFLDDDTSFVVNQIQAPPEYSSDYRLTLDTIEDFELLEFIHNELYRPGSPVDLLEALALLDENPKIASVNMDIKPKLDRSEIDTSLRI